MCRGLMLGVMMGGTSDVWCFQCCSAFGQARMDAMIPSVPDMCNCAAIDLFRAMELSPISLLRLSRGLGSGRGSAAGRGTRNEGATDLLPLCDQHTIQAARAPLVRSIDVPESKVGMMKRQSFLLACQKMSVRAWAPGMRLNAVYEVGTVKTHTLICCVANR